MNDETIQREFTVGGTTVTVTSTMTVEDEHIVGDISVHAEAPATVGWHRHRWSPWSAVSDSTGGLVQAIKGTDAMKAWQERFCVHCNRIDRRFVGWESQI